MSLIVETGEGVENANTYVSLADAQAFVDARELAVTLTEGHILRGMDALSSVDLLPFTGSVPNGVVVAQIWLAYYVNTGDDPAARATPAIKKEVVGPIQTEFAVAEGQDDSFNALSFPNVVAALRGLTSSSRTLSRA